MQPRVVEHGRVVHPTAQLAEVARTIERVVEHHGVAGVADDRGARGIREPVGGSHVDDHDRRTLVEQHLGDAPADTRQPHR